MPAKTTKIAFDTPGSYRIRIQGKLGADWGDSLAGLVIRVAKEENGHDVTTLEGKLIDQSQLAGVLDTLSNLRFPLLTVERVEANSLEATVERSAQENRQ